MATKVYIVEDEPLIAATIETALEKEGYQVVGCADNAKEAAFDIETLLPDIFLVDITLDGKMDGVDLVEHLKSKLNIPFIFITSLSDDITIERVKNTSPSGFIVKPFNERMLKTNIELALHQFNNQNKQVTEEASFISNSFFIKDKGELQKIELQNILYVEAYDNYCFIHTRQQKFLVSQTLKYLEEKLPAQQFLRVHRSYIINLDEIKSIMEGCVYIEKHRIPVSHSYRAILLSKVQLL
jgi:DNA-binding LytR/AlgR family response regulator